MLESVKELVKRKLGMTYKGRCVREVLVAFKRMGADANDLKQEKRKLEEDEMYLAEWHVAVNPPRRLSYEEVEFGKATDVHGEAPDSRRNPRRRIL